MPRYSAEQIYNFARQAGFSPDEAATMTAIALAESSGDSRARATTGEDSRGLWQINAQAHPQLAQKYDLYDPLQNARAAYEVSRGGADISPWTVTHGGADARYLRYRGNADAAAVAAGDGSGRGVWTGTPGYGHPLAAGADGGTGPAPVGTNPALTRFLDEAQAQVGDRYIFGAETDLDDPNPEAFDCSELTQWAAHQAGVTIPDGAAGQYRYLKNMGLLIPVEEAKRTPGALLFHFASDPTGGSGEPPVAHVAISTGDGRTIEARNSRAGVVNADAGDRFTFAAIIPGISDGSAVVPAVEQPPLVFGGPDTDQDQLADGLEQRLGLDPTRADTDGDNLPDAYELVTSHTDPRAADSDGDELIDAFELARGLDPMSPDTDADGHLDGALAVTWVDSDGDGLDDNLERALRLDPNRADSDADGFGDKLEVTARTNPLDPQSNPLRSAADGLGLDDSDPTPVT
jgi:cell wall-associated NlpC family hydrolase